MIVAVQINKIAPQLVGNEDSGKTVSNLSLKHVNLGYASKELFGKEALLCFVVFHVKQFRRVVHAHGLIVNILCNISKLVPRQTMKSHWAGWLVYCIGISWLLLSYNPTMAAG